MQGTVFQGKFGLIIARGIGREGSRDGSGSRCPKWLWNGPDGHGDPVAFVRSLRSDLG